MRTKPTLEIDLDIIKNNYLNLKQLCNTSVGAALKANAYGLGATNIAKKIHSVGCREFFLANLDEAIYLRENIKDANIYVLNGILNGEGVYFQEYNLIPVINDLYQLEIIKSYSVQKNISSKIAIHFDTGMNRLGVPDCSREKFVEYLIDCNNIHVELIMSHLSSAGEKGSQQNILQLNNFNNILVSLENKGFKAKSSLANSEGIFLGASYHYDLVRPGAALYGLRLTEEMSFLGNPIKLFTHLLQVKRVPKGEKIGYNLTYELSRDSVVGTIPIGYADGIFRSLSNKGCCFIGGRMVSFIGRVSMDLVNIDLTDLPESLRMVGQEVVFIGENQRPERIAEQIECIPYEVITAIGNRYEKKYLNV
jgi:alanine racemase